MLEGIRAPRRVAQTAWRKSKFLASFWVGAYRFYQGPSLT